MRRANRGRIVACVVLGLIAGFSGVRAVSQPRNDFHFTILGDRTGGAAPEVYGRVWREIALLHPDFVINVGDTIQGGNDARAEAEWTDVRRVWDRYRDFPLYLIPGNHDIWSDFSAKLFEKQTGRPASYSFNYQEAHFTVLDNSRTTDLSPEQLKFLEQDLRRHQSRRPKFVFFHKPYWLVFLKLGSGEFPLHALSRKYGVDYVISGHGHQFLRMVRDGVVYMEVGSSGANIAGALRKGEGFAQGRFYHHVWGRVKGSKVSFTVKEIDGVMGRGRMFNAGEWDANGPKFDVEDPAKEAKPES